MIIIICESIVWLVLLSFNIRSTILSVNNDAFSASEFDFALGARTRNANLLAKRQTAACACYAPVHEHAHERPAKRYARRPESAYRLGLSVCAWLAKATSDDEPKGRPKY